LLYTLEKNGYLTSAQQRQISARLNGGVGNAIQATQHGSQRLTERGFTASDISLTKSTNIIKTQANGAKVYIKEVSSDRFNVIIEGNKGVVIASKNISQKALDRLSNNYGWK
jgi:hypothetical protein